MSRFKPHHHTSYVQVHIPPPDADIRETLLFLDMAGREAALGVEDIEILVK